MAKTYCEMHNTRWRHKKGIRHGIELKNYPIFMVVLKFDFVFHLHLERKIEKKLVKSLGKSFAMEKHVKWRDQEGKHI
jgi:hypothetical protein